MKYLLILLLMIPFNVLAQTQADYEQAMQKFMRFYNAQQADSICRLLDADPEKKCFWKMVIENGDPQKKNGTSVLPLPWA